MTAIQQILDAYKEGHGAVLLTGRSLYDFVCDDSKMRPLFEAVRRALYREFGMVFVMFSLANGVNWFENWIASDADRRAIRNALQNSGLLGAAVAGEDEIVSVVRSVATLVRASTEDLKWQDGKPMRFAVCFEFTEHFVPCSMPGGQTEAQLVVAELVHIMSQSLALRDSGNFLLFHGRV